MHPAQKRSAAYITDFDSDDDEYPVTTSTASGLHGSVSMTPTNTILFTNQTTATDSLTTSTATLSSVMNPASTSNSLTPPTTTLPSAQLPLTTTPPTTGAPIVSLSATIQDLINRLNPQPMSLNGTPFHFQAHIQTSTTTSTTSVLTRPSVMARPKALPRQPPKKRQNTCHKSKIFCCFNNSSTRPQAHTKHRTR